MVNATSLSRYTVLGATVTLLLAGILVAVVVVPRVGAVPRPPVHHLHYTITDLGTLPGGAFNGSEASAINDQGQVVGDSYFDSDRHHAFLWQRGAMQDLGTLPGASDSYAYAINDQGQIVGLSSLSNGDEHAVRGRTGGYRTWAPCPVAATVAPSASMRAARSSAGRTPAL